MMLNWGKKAQRKKREKFFLRRRLVNAIKRSWVMTSQRIFERSMAMRARKHVYEKRRKKNELCMKCWNVLSDQTCLRWRARPIQLSSKTSDTPDTDNWNASESSDLWNINFFFVKFECCNFSSVILNFSTLFFISLCSNCWLEFVHISMFFLTWMNFSSLIYPPKKSEEHWNIVWDSAFIAVRREKRSMK